MTIDFLLLTNLARSESLYSINYSQSSFGEVLIYKRNVNLHRVGRPAVITLLSLKSKTLFTLEHWRYGKRHCVNGPAFITSSYDAEEKEYYLYDKQYSKEDFERKIKQWSLDSHAGEW